MCVQRAGTPGIYSRAVRPQKVCLYSISEPRGSVCFVISPNNLYTFIYVINGRLEADGINSVVFNLCAPQVFPPQLVLVTRISLCQPGVEDLKEEHFNRTHRLD